MQVVEDGMSIFRAAMKSKATRETYEYYLNRFLKETEIRTASNLLRLGKEDPNKLTSIVIETIGKYKEKLESGETSASTVQGIYKPVKLFCDMNDIAINWRKISKLLPQSNNGDDRAITVEEIRRLLKHADLREKAIILTMVSSGIRVGAFPYLKVKHLEPVMEDGKVLGAKLIVYARTPDEYVTFLSPEAYGIVDEYLEYRKRHGEDLTRESPLFRNKFRSDARKVEVLERDAVRAIMHRLMRAAGLRNGKIGKRHEFQTDHGFRKFFKTRTEQVMKPIHVEMLMGHSMGISRAYYKPKAVEVFQDYKKAIPLLTTEQSVQLNDTQKDLAELNAKYNELRTILKDHGILNPD